MALTVFDSLKGVSAYPIPLRTLTDVAERRGVSLTDEATQDVLNTSAYCLAKADLLMWLSLAPDVSQGGQSYSFTDEQRTQLRTRATQLYNAFSDSDTDATTTTTIYGYKGSRL